MQTATLQVNRHSKPTMRTVGNERTPVVIIDDFAVDIDAVRNEAYHSANFAVDGTAYPGVRAPLTRGHVMAELEALHPLLCSTYSIPPELRLRLVNAAFSLVATPEKELRILQCLPHFDSSRPYYIAITHYLAAGEFGGTGFYRHRPTGFETVTEDRVAKYVEAGDAFLAAHGDPRQNYFGESDDHYELYDRVEYKSNRLVAYPGYLLHSGLVDPRRDIDPDPRSGRLTSNVFIDFQ